MFGSGDDKKSSQPAPSADTPETVDATVNESAAKSAKKGLFSWFSKKTAEPETVEPRAVAPTATETSPQSGEPQQAEQTPSVAEPQPVLSANVEPAEDEQVVVPASTVQPSTAALESARPVALAIEPELASAETVFEPVQGPVTETKLPEPMISSVVTPVLPSAAFDLDPVTSAATESAPEHSNLEFTAPSVEPIRPAYSRFRISGGSEVVVPPIIVAAIVEPESEQEQEIGEVKLDVNLGGQDKPQDNKASWFARLRQGLAKTSSSLGEGMASLFLGKKEIDDDLLDELETRLLTADVGMEATSAIMGNLIKRVARKELADSGALYQALQVEMADLLRPIEQPMQITAEKNPYVILVVGVNGAGKTTTIGKLAARLQKEGKKVMLAAGDTFRAAAVEQLQVWGERNKIPVIAQHTGADSASVIFDAVQAAKSRGMDVLIADTAGRLHTKDNLMEELRKVGRVMSKLDDSAPHEVLLVLDAGTGQNAINQTRQFNATIPVTGLALTKLDGTAKGGVIFALAKHFEIPVRYIGVGEGIDDLRDFVADDFVKALFAEKDSA